MPDISKAAKKPRLRLWRGQWLCVVYGEFVHGRSSTGPQEAYERWLNITPEEIEEQRQMLGRDDAIIWPNGVLLPKPGWAS